MIDWKRIDTQIYCKRICILFKWKFWTNCVICSTYNAAWFVGDLQDHCLVVDISLNNCLLNCMLIDWQQNNAQIYCERIWLLFGWKCWTNCVICSAYNAAWEVGDLQGHGFASWHFFEQLLVELHVDLLRAQSWADILWEDLHTV